MQGSWRSTIALWKIETNFSHNSSGKMRKKGVVRKCSFLRFSLKCSILELLRNAGFMAFHNRIVENRNKFLTQLKRQNEEKRGSS